MWQGILGDFIDPTTGTALSTHPRFIGTLDLLECRSIRAFVVKMVRVILSAKGVPRNQLASIGAMRLYKQEVVSMVKKASLLMELSVASPSFVSNRLLRTGQVGDTDAVAQGLQFTQDWGNHNYAVWLLGVAGDALCLLYTSELPTILRV